MMNVNQNMQTSGFYSTAMFMASNQVNSAPMQQMQQLQGMLQSMFQNLFQAGAGQAQNMTGGFAQTPTMPGFVSQPGAGMMTPTNPTFGGGMQTGGMIAGGGMQTGGMMVGGMMTTGGMTTMPKQEKSGLIQTGKTPPEFTTPGGYKIKAEGKSAGWKITTPEGKTTLINGDPHVREGDGGKWDFKKQMSFVLPDGTKITCKTTPPRKNGYTVSQSIDIMNGNERATIGGIDKNKPTTGGVKQDRWAVDASTKDGDYAVLGGNGDDWFLNGKNEIVGSENKGSVLKTRAGGNNNITNQARAQMNEANPGLAQQPTRPSFGGPQFMMQMMMQMLQQMMQQMQRPMGF